MIAKCTMEILVFILYFGGFFVSFPLYLIDVFAVGRKFCVKDDDVMDEYGDFEHIPWDW